MRTQMSRSALGAWSAHSSRASNRCWSASITGPMCVPLVESWSLCPPTDTGVIFVTPCPPMDATHAQRRLTLGDVLREHARSRPDGLAVVDRDWRATYAQLDARVNRLAAA